jgi:5-methylcytosine-specific restriction endonuclease McrA
VRPNAEDRGHPGEATAASHAVSSGIFLFGSDRVIPPKALRDGIAALQDGQRFYCGQTLGATSEADHFIPRIRSGIDAIENLVLADRRCNNDKRDLLPGPRM